MTPSFFYAQIEACVADMIAAYSFRWDYDAPVIQDTIEEIKELAVEIKEFVDLFVEAVIEEETP